MQTRCPHCRTLFVINEIQLTAASGQARCSYCDNIFNARKHLIQTDPVDRSAQDTGQPQKAGGTISLNGLFEEQETEEEVIPEFNADVLSADDNRDREKLPAGAWQPESESSPPFAHPEKSKTDTESVHLIDTQSFAVMLEGEESGQTNPEPAASEPLEDALTQARRRQSVDSEGVTGERFNPESNFQPGPTHKTRQERHPVLWSISILCLLATALAQLVWFTRDNLKHYPEVRELLEIVCAQAGCILPPWHEPERFVISNRLVRTHPKNSNALQIQLVFNNTARFAQFYPQLQLKLYDTSEKLSAQRVFRPEEYLAEPLLKSTLIKPTQSVEVDMALADPGTDVTGFKIEFL